MAPNNPLTCWGNEKTMNMNSLILTNIQSSPYFKVNLYELKTYHEVIDEIYYKVDHLEPWEKGSRKTAGQTGMCGGVRGVGAGGIVASAYCLLYKLFTLKLTRKQVLGLCSHTDSPYIRALGFMYIRYTQPPNDLWEWYKDFLDDDEEIDVKAGGGHSLLIGEMLKQWMTKLEWYGTLFPRIPVPTQKMIEHNMLAYYADKGIQAQQAVTTEVAETEEPEPGWGEAERVSRLKEDTNGREGSKEKKSGSGRASPPFDISKAIEKEKQRQKRRSRSKDRDRDRDRHSHRSDRERTRKRSRSRERKRSRSRERKRSRDRRSRSRDRKRRSNSREKDRKRRSRSRDRHSRNKHRSRSRDRDRSTRHRESSFDRDLKKERSRIKDQNGD